MKKFETFAIKKSTFKNRYLIVPHPFTADIYEIIEEFNKINSVISNGCLIIDLETIVGNRKGKIVALDVLDFKIDRSTISEFFGSTKAIEDFKLEYYVTLDNKIKKRLFPIEFRNQVFKSCI